MTDENKQRLDSYIEAVNRRIDIYKNSYGGNSSDHQYEVTQAMWYSLEAGGKRIRPVLAEEFCRVCGGSSEQALTAAAAVEMIHTFSLIHDDLPCMDNDDYRRGRPSCHKAFREDTALLAGDALENLAYRIIADDDKLSAEKKVMLIRELTEAVGIHGMIGGQVIDMYNDGTEVFSDEKLLKMYMMKTSALLRAACRMGCICAGAYDRADDAGNYADRLGLAFQIIDDILDITSSEEVLGKTCGSDAASGKCTYAAVHGVKASEEYAAVLTDEAMTYLERFEDNKFLIWLTEQLLHRKS
ncbi:MAG: polyprenyl synthetase family protein [Oscillospiraceae bacterium]|nr:polyprenyl synthetase family protein [Oscillospiraceae bacterium]